MNAYVIPREVDDDFRVFKDRHADFLAGRLDGPAFRPHRVPFGVYEQRRAGTYMVRVKLAGGQVNLAQLEVLAGLAEAYGDGRIHVTTRGGAQIHYVAAENIPVVLAALHASSLTGRGSGGDTVRGITGDPLAGVAADEAFDVTPHMLAITSKMLAPRDSYGLPRKFKIAMSGSSADRGGALCTDVCFIARIRDGQRGFRVYVGGGMGIRFRLGDEFTDFLPENEAFLFAQAVKELFGERGNRKNRHAARLRFLVEELGFPAFRELVLERIETVRARGGWDIGIASVAEEKTGGAPPLSMEDCSSGERLWFRRFALPQKQAGLYAVRIPLTLGDLSVADARALVEALRRAVPEGGDLVRFSPDQNLYLRGLSADALRCLHPVAQRISPLAAKPALLGDIVACTGALTCGLGITVPRGAVGKIGQALEEAGLDLEALQGFRIRLSGCPNNCGGHCLADLGFFGKVLHQNGVPYPAYKVFAGARTRQGVARFARPAGAVAAFHLPAFVVDVLRTWLALKDAHAGFAGWIDQDGRAVIAELAKKYVTVPDFTDDSRPYFDFSCEEVFSLKRRPAKPATRR